MSVTRRHVAPRMSQAVVHGQTVYLAGQVADQAKGKSVGEQAKDILAGIDRLLAEAGSDKTKILSATIYLADIGTFAEMNACTPVEHLPGEIVMPATAMVDAALAGLDQGEFATVPSLPNLADWNAYEAARQALMPNLSRAEPAARLCVRREAA